MLVQQALDFTPWPHLNQLAAEWQSGESQVILKARQIGVSYLLATYATYKMLAGQTVLMFSKGQREASELMEKARYVYDALPDGGRPELTARNDSELATDRGRILAFPSTEDAGRGWTADLIIADEAAFHPYAARNYQSYRPASLDKGGQMLMVSTANGHSGFFHEMYQSAKGGVAPLLARFLRWDARPDRDAAWYDTAKAAFVGLAAEFEAEYPVDDESAFTATAGQNPFGLAAIRDALAPVSVNGAVCYGVDVAESVDWTVAIGLDRDGVVCRFERWQSSWEETIARIRGLVYGVPALVDATGVGSAVLKWLSADRGGNFMGFTFTETSRVEVLKNLAVMIQKKQVKFPDGLIRGELEAFEYVMTSSGKVLWKVAEGLHDDCVMALALAARHYNTVATTLETPRVRINQQAKWAWKAI